MGILEYDTEHIRIPLHIIYMCRCALTNEENSCYSYSDDVEGCHAPEINKIVRRG